MLAAWVEAGQDPANFWSLTLREITSVMDGAAVRIRNEHNARAWAVWHVAALGRAKTIPPLRRLLVQGPVRAQSADEMEAAVMAWTEVQKRRDERMH